MHCSRLILGRSLHMGLVLFEWTNYFCASLPFSSRLLGDIWFASIGTGLALQLCTIAVLHHTIIIDWISRNDRKQLLFPGFLAVIDFILFGV
jgi:hypothetical protein